MRREIELAQVVLALAEGNGGIDSADGVFALQQGVEPWLDVFGRLVALVCVEQNGTEINLWRSHGDLDVVEGAKSMIGFCPRSGNTVESDDDL